MTSWTRNTHMPRVEASRCCSASSNWCATCAWADAAAASANGCLPRRGLGQSIERLVVVRVARDHRGLREVLRRGRRCRLPLEPRGAPRIGRCDLAVAQRPEEVEQGQEIADAEDRCPGGRQHVEHLKLLRVDVVATRHPEIPEDELREERQ